MGVKSFGNGSDVVLVFLDFCVGRAGVTLCLCFHCGTHWVLQDKRGEKTLLRVFGFECENGFWWIMRVEYRE